jgi:Spy/CpxP family protein refolding chaperone
MFSRKLKGMLVVAAAGAMAMVSVGALAQAPAGGPGGGPPRGPGGGGGFAAPTDRAGVIQRFGLNAPELKLTDAQKAQIDKLADAFLEESKKQPPMQPGAQMTPEAMQARQAPRQNLVTAVGKVLTDEQRKTFDAAQAAQRRPMGGPGGPPGGGPGGPPGGNR